jgi:gliding motility-associated-like protein
MDTLGCVNFIEKWINLYYPSIVYIPNAFSPDDNGVNDFFFPNLMSVKELDFAIFNRWGQRIFYAKDVRSKWDGTYNGVLCPEDVYIYKIKTVSVLGIKNEYVGHVTLYRNEF